LSGDQEESYSANCLPVNDFLLIPKGFPKSKKQIVELGYIIIELDMSEFRKMDGGLTCLSLLFK
jgi:dimethylargininase